MRKTMTIGLRLTLVLVILLTSILLTDFSGATPVASASTCGWTAEPGWVEIAVQVNFQFTGASDWVDFTVGVESEDSNYNDDQEIRVTRFYGEDYGVNAWGFDVPPNEDITVTVTWEEGDWSSSVDSITQTSACPGRAWTDTEIANGDAWSLYVFDADD